MLSYKTVMTKLRQS